MIKKHISCTAFSAMVTLLASSFAMMANAQTALLSVEDAHAMAAKGDVVLIDIRTPSEWSKTGTPEYAELVQLQRDDFIETILAKQAEHPDATIALICRSGGRSTHAAQLLEQAGLSKLYNVKEGVEGGSNGTSWISKDLPLKTYSAE